MEYKGKSILGSGFIVILCVLLLIGTSLRGDEVAYNIYMSAIGASATIVLGLSARFLGYKQLEISKDMKTLAEVQRINAEEARDIALLSDIKGQLNDLTNAKNFFDTMKITFLAYPTLNFDLRLPGTPVDFPMSDLLNCTYHLQENETDAYQNEISFVFNEFLEWKGAKDPNRSFTTGIKHTQKAVKKLDYKIRELKGQRESIESKWRKDGKIKINY